MNINASNHSLDNVIIQQKTEAKRPSFASVFEKLNKRVEKMNRKTPLNNVLTNEQLFRYYVKETEPLLKKSNEDFGEGNISLGDIIRNLKSTMEESGGTNGGNSPEEPPVDEPVKPYGLINNLMEKAKTGNIASKNRFSVFEDLNEDDMEAGAPISNILENSYYINAMDDDEASFDPRYLKEPDGNLLAINSRDGNSFFVIQQSKNITDRRKKSSKYGLKQPNFSTSDAELERDLGISFDSPAASGRFILS